MGLLLGASCSGNSGAKVTPTASQTMTPVVWPSPTETPRGGPPITAANAASMKPVASFAAVRVQRLAWANDGRLFVIGTLSVDAVEPATGAGKRALDVIAPERILGVSPVGIAAVAGGEGAPVRLVDLATGKTTQTLAAGGITNSATFFKGDRVVLVAGDRIAATIWSTVDGKRVGELIGFQTAAPVYNVVVSSDGARAACVSRGTLQFSESASNGTATTMGAKVSFQDFIGAYTFLPDGKGFATTVGTDPGSPMPGLVQLWDPSTGKETLRFALGWLPLTIAASTPMQNAPKLLATGGEGVTLWSAADGRQIATFDRPTAGRVSLASFAPDASSLVTVAEEGGVRIWRPAR